MTPPTLIADRERAKPSKYRNVPVEIDGIRFASKAEARRYSDLKLLERAREIQALRRQVRFPLHVDGIRVATYVSDFAYEDGDGTIVVEDVKGVATEIFKLKAKMFEAQYGFPITIIRGRR